MEKEIIRAPITWRIIALVIAIVSLMCYLILFILSANQMKRDIAVMEDTTKFMLLMAFTKWDSDTEYHLFWGTVEAVFYISLIALIVYVNVVGCPDVVIFTECFE